ncbi:hypothetical protein [Chromobacterium haemolyticum]|uniref:hypothetical protein n=1 Tax=Chromobacterium haemolyticum TaxID=394935 RepID=UPI00307DABFC
MSAGRMERLLGRLLAEPGVGRACRELALRMAAEEGATRALDEVEKALLGQASHSTCS